MKKRTRPAADDARDDVAMTSDGQIFDIGESVRAKVIDMVDRGTVIALIVEVDGDVAVQVFGPPDQRVIAILEQALNGLKTALRHETTTEHPS